MDGDYNSHSLNDDKESFKFPMLSKNSGKNKKSAYEKKSGMSSGGKSGMSFDWQRKLQTTEPIRSANIK